MSKTRQPYTVSPTAMPPAPPQKRHQDRVATVLDQCAETIREAALATIWY